MTETVKKTTAKTTKAKAKAPAKPGKAAAAPEAEVKRKAEGNVTEMPVPRERLAELARKFWAERGYQDGHHEDDWFRAERELRGMAS